MQSIKDMKQSKAHPERGEQHNIYIYNLCTKRNTAKYMGIRKRMVKSTVGREVMIKNGFT